MRNIGVFVDTTIKPHKISFVFIVVVIFEFFAFFLNSFLFQVIQNINAHVDIELNVSQNIISADCYFSFMGFVFVFIFSKMQFHSIRIHIFLFHSLAFI